MLVCTHCRIVLRDNETLCPRDGRTGEPLDFPELPAELAARFELVEPFASGSTGTLWLVDDTQSGRRGLLKRLSEDDHYRAADKQRIRREWTKQTTLDDPQLARLYELGESEGQLWCFREWVEGVSLAVRLSRGPLTEAELLATSDALAAALDALHRAGLLHRDVKPGHVLLQPQPGSDTPVVKLLDAGSPSPLTGASGERMWGTPAYLAPEQASGKLVSFRSDLYSLGCVLFEAAEGEPPFVDDDPLEVVRLQREADAPAPPGALPEALRGLVGSLLAKEAQRRPFSAQKVRKTLAPHIPGRAEKSPTETFATHGLRGSNGASLPAGRSVPPPPPRSTPPARSTSVPPPVPPSASKPPGTSAPPPVPPSASRSSGPPPVPPAARRGRPTSAPPPVPPTARAGSKPSAPPSSDATQPIELEQVVAVSEHLGRASEPSSDATQPVQLEQLVDVLDLGSEAAGDTSAETQPEGDATAPPAEPRAAEDGAEAVEPRVEAGAEDGADAGGDVAAAEPTEDAATATDAETDVAQSVDAASTDVEGQDRAEPPEAEAAPTNAAEQPASETGEAPATDANVASETEDAGAAASHADLPDEKTVAGVRVHVELPPRESTQSQPPAEGVAAEGTPAHSRATAGDDEGLVAGPEPADEGEDDQPTRVVDRQEVLAAAGADVPQWDDDAREEEIPTLHAARREELLPGQGADEAVPTQRREAETFGSAARQSEPTQIMTGPADERRRRATLVSIAAAAVVLLGLIGWAVRGDEAETPAVAANEPQDEPAAGAAPKPAAAKEPPVVEPMAEQVAQPGTAEEPGAQDAERHEETAQAETQDEAAEVESAQPGGTLQVVELAEQAATDQAGEQGEGEDKAKRSGRGQRGQGKARRGGRARRGSRGGGLQVDAVAWHEARTEARKHYQQRHYRKAEAAYERAARANPRDAGTFAGLGASRLALGNPRGAARAYRQAVKLSPKTSHFHAALGRAYEEAGDRRRARSSYHRAMQIDPNNRVAKSGLAKL